MGQLSRRQLSWGNFSGGHCLGGNYPEGIILGGNCPRGNCPGGQLSEEQLSWNRMDYLCNTDMSLRLIFWAYYEQFWIKCLPDSFLCLHILHFIEISSISIFFLIQLVHRTCYLAANNSLSDSFKTLCWSISLFPRFWLH